LLHLVSNQASGEAGIAISRKVSLNAREVGAQVLKLLEGHLAAFSQVFESTHNSRGGIMRQQFFGQCSAGIIQQSFGIHGELAAGSVTQCLILLTDVSVTSGIQILIPLYQGIAMLNMVRGEHVRADLIPDSLNVLHQI
jgi:hypothetical protein